MEQSIKKDIELIANYYAKPEEKEQLKSALIRLVEKASKTEK